MRLFLMQYFAASGELRPDAAQSFAPNENNGRFYQPFLPVSPDQLPDQALAAVRPLAHQAIAQAARTYIFVKTHHWFGVHHGTPTVSLKDTAAAVYLVRNPLDVVVSYAAFRNVSFDQAIDWLLAEGRILPRMPKGSYFVSGSWSQNVSSWRNQSQVPCTFLRYEDMVAQPKSEFRRLLAAWRLKIDDDRLDQAVAATSLEALKAVEAKHGFKERPASTKSFFRSGQTGEGYEKLTETQKGRVIAGCGQVMEELGYSTHLSGA